MKPCHVTYFTERSHFVYCKHSFSLFLYLLHLLPRLSPEDCWDRLQPTRDPTEGLSKEKMDGWMLHLPPTQITYG